MCVSAGYTLTWSNGLSAVQNKKYAYICLYGNMSRMKRTAVFLKEEQLKKLQAISDKTGAPVAELIRSAIDAYLQKAR